MKSSDWTPVAATGLFEAAKGGDDAAALRLLDAGANVNEKDAVRVPARHSRARSDCARSRLRPLHTHGLRRRRWGARRTAWP